MSGEGYSDKSFPIADKFRLKLDTSIDVSDAVVMTGNTLENKIEVEKYNSSYDPSAIIGNSLNRLSADDPYRAITVNVSGADRVRVTEDVEAFDLLTGAGFQFTELFDGSGNDGQQIQVENPYISGVVSVIEDPSGSPTEYTQVSTKQTPTGNQFNVDLDTGIITLGTSVSGTDNYQVIYNIDDGRYKKMKPSDALITETITVTTHVGTLSELPEFDGVIIVDGTTGSSTGIKEVIYSGTPSAGQVLVEPDDAKLTFNTADAITEADVSYLPFARKTKALALESKEAGNYLDVIYIHKH